MNEKEGIRALELAVAMFVVDLLSSEAMVEAASKALDRGLTAPSLMALALLDRHDVRRETVLELSADVFADMGLEFPTLGDAADAVIRDTAAKILEGTVGPYDGARRIWDLSLQVKGPLAEYGTFIYAASEWHDRPDMQPKFADAILEAARDLARAD